MRNLIQCPTCLSRGLIRNIAEVLPGGYIKIQRMATNTGIARDYTLIKGTEFILMCGECGKSVYIRKEEDESSFKRSQWFYRITFTGSTVTQGIRSGTDYAGTSLFAN